MYDPKPIEPMQKLSAGVHDAEDVMEMVQDHEVASSYSEYNKYTDDENTEKPGAIPWMIQDN